MSMGCNTCAFSERPGGEFPCHSCEPGERASGWTDPVLLADQRRLQWLLPVIGTAGDPDHVGNARTMALGAALMLGKTDRDAIDFAMEGSP